MWSGASVAHTSPVREDLGSILQPTQTAFSQAFISFLSNNVLKTKSLICEIVMICWINIFIIIMMMMIWAGSYYNHLLSSELEN